MLSAWPLREDHELRRALPTWFFARGQLLYRQHASILCKYHVLRGDGRSWSPSRTHADRRCVADLGIRTQVRSRLLKTVHRWRWGRTLDDLDRIIVLARPICTAFIALLFEELLCLGIRKPKKQLHAVLSEYVVKFREDLFGNFTGFKSKDKLAVSSELRFNGSRHLPGKPDFLTHTSLLVAADLLRNHFVWVEVTAKILFKTSAMEGDAMGQSTHRFRPFNRNVGAVNIGRRLVFKILEARIARFLGLSACVKPRMSDPYLSKTCLVSEIEKAADAVLTRLKVEVLYETEPAAVSEDPRERHKLPTPCKDPYPDRRLPCSGQSCRSEKHKQRASRQWSLAESP